MRIMKHTINIAEEFSTTPGARYPSDGEFSGQDFYDRILKEKFSACIKQGAVLIVVLDGTHGYATSFLDEAFGRLVDDFGINKTKKNLEFISIEEPYLIEEIWGYVDKRALAEA